LTNGLLAAVFIASGCAFSQIQGLEGPVRVELARPDQPETVLKDVTLDSRRRVQGVTDVAGRIATFVGQLAKDTGGEIKTLRQSRATIRSLQERGYFMGSVLAPNSLVIYVDAAGSFTTSDEVSGQAHDQTFSHLAAIFDPADGELLAYGFLP
jgi:hypothetical protein